MPLLNLINFIQLFSAHELGQNGAVTIQIKFLFNWLGKNHAEGLTSSN